MATRKAHIKRLRKAEERAALAIECIAAKYAKFDQNAVWMAIKARPVVHASTAADATTHCLETIANCLAAMAGLDEQTEQDD